MPKIDTTKIGGFEAMTAEEKLAALLGLEIPEPVDMSTLVSKTTFDKVSSELAEAKRKLEGKMTEDEVAKAEAKREREELEQKYNELLEKSTVSEYKAKYMAQGYDEKLAAETAVALFKGDMETVFNNSAKFKTAVEQRVKSDVLKGTPRPEGAGGKNGLEKSADILMAERIGRLNADSNKIANDTISKYTGGN